MIDRDIPLWRNTAMTRLVEEQGRVVGIEVRRNGRPLRIQARKAVVLAAGGADAGLPELVLDIALALAVARRYRDAVVTAVCPGWVRTRMGGSGAPTDLRTGAATQVWLATSEEPGALISGRFMRHMRNLAIPRAATDTDLQEGLLAACRTISGFGLPAPDEPDVRS